MVVLKLLGSCTVWINGKEVSDISAKALGLLCYLALARTPQDRSHIAALLWTDKPPALALTNLRGILHELKVISDANNTTLIDANRRSLQLSAETQFDIDAAEFSRLVSQENSKETLQQANDLYAGQFLPGFSLRGADEFDEWVATKRATLQDNYIGALENLADLNEQISSLDLSVRSLQAITQLEPFREDIHLRLMKLFLQTGKRASALQQYEQCKNILATELNTTPSSEIQNLYNSLTESPAIQYPDGSIHNPASEAGKHKFIVGPPITQSHHFFGRENYLQRIFGWWQQPPFGHVAIVGKRRSGKTSLLKHLKPISGSHTEAVRRGQKSNWLANAQSYRWIEINFQDPRMRSLSKVLAHILKGCDLNPPDNCTLETFMEVATENPWRTPTIILMDELEAGLASDELDQAFWWSLRALTQMTDGYIGIALAAFDRPMQAADNMNKTSPFFNIFSTLELGPFEVSEAKSFIQSIDIDFTESDCQWILEQSGCWPCLLQLLCQENYIARQSNNGTEKWQDNALNQLQSYAYLLQ